MTTTPATIVWKFGGDRLVPLTPALVQAADFPPSEQPPTVLDISERVWDKPSLSALLEHKLPKDLSSLTVLKFDDMIAGLQTEDGLAALTYLAETMSVRAKNLRSLEFHQNATGTRGIQALAPLLRLPFIESIDASNNGLSKEVMVEFKNYLHADTLVTLKLGRNAIQQGAIHVGELLAECTKLQVFWYDGSRPEEEGTAYLLEGLAKMDKSHLRELNLYDCSIKTAELLPAIENAPNLRLLNLSSTDVDASQAEGILNVLVNYSLVSLDLSYHDEWIEEDHLGLIVDYFTNAPKTLEEVSLEAWFLGDEGVKTIMAALALHPIRRLVLQSNDVEDTEILHGLKHLKYLDLRDNMDLTGLSDLSVAYPNTEIIVDDGQKEELQSTMADNDDPLDGLADQLASAGI